MTVRTSERTDVTMAVTARHEHQADPAVSDDTLREAASVLGVDAPSLRALQAPSPYRKVPVRLALLGDAPIYVSTPHRAEELQAADRSYRLTVR